MAIQLNSYLYLWIEPYGSEAGPHAVAAGKVSSPARPLMGRVGVRPPLGQSVDDGFYQLFLAADRGRREVPVGVDQP